MLAQFPQSDNLKKSIDHHRAGFYMINVYDIMKDDEYLGGIGVFLHFLCAGITKICFACVLMLLSWTREWQNDNISAKGVAPNVAPLTQMLLQLWDITWLFALSEILSTQIACVPVYSVHTTPN